MQKWGLHPNAGDMLPFQFLPSLAAAVQGGGPKSGQGSSRLGAGHGSNAQRACRIAELFCLLQATLDLWRFWQSPGLRKQMMLKKQRALQEPKA